MCCRIVMEGSSIGGALRADRRELVACAAVLVALLGGCTHQHDDRGTLTGSGGSGARAAEQSQAQAGSGGGHASTAGDHAGAGHGGSAADAGAADGKDAMTAGASSTDDAGLGDDASAPDGPPPTFHAPCLDLSVDYARAGPFVHKVEQSDEIKLWVPDVPAGCKIPVIYFVGGTGATCDPYQGTLERLASHGFLAICSNDPSTGREPKNLPFEVALMLHPELVGMSFGSMGHEVGGQVAITLLQRAEEYWKGGAVYAGLATQPASGGSPQPDRGSWTELYAALRAPMFLWSSLMTDGIVSQSWVQQAYDALNPNAEGYFWTADGAKHIPVPNAEMQEIAVPWFRWKLLGDQNACRYFKAIPAMDARWAEVASKYAAPCL